MTEDHLKQALTDLQEALNTNETQLSSESVADVNALIKSIEQQLSYPDTDAEIDTLLDEIKGKATSLEVTHPKVAAVLQQVLTILNSMGL
jgi:uncharacterized coiled-coil DUF342 family protein